MIAAEFGDGDDAAAAVAAEGEGQQSDGQVEPARGEESLGDVSNASDSGVVESDTPAVPEDVPTGSASEAVAPPVAAGDVASASAASATAVVADAAAASSGTPSDIDDAPTGDASATPDKVDVTAPSPPLDEGQSSALKEDAPRHANADSAAASHGSISSSSIADSMPQQTSAANASQTLPLSPSTDSETQPPGRAPVSVPPTLADCRYPPNKLATNATSRRCTALV